MKRDLPLTDAHLDQEVTVALRVRDLLRLASDAPAIDVALAAVVQRPQLPAIGSKMDDGIFAGVTLHNDEAFALVLLPGDFTGTWAEAKDWADKEGGVLPSRHDQLVLSRDLKSEFKEAWYWSGEQHAEFGDCAWTQYFYYGAQNYYYVTLRSRARAVRRFAIR